MSAPPKSSRRGRAIGSRVWARRAWRRLPAFRATIVAPAKIVSTLPAFAAFKTTEAQLLSSLGRELNGRTRAARDYCSAEPNKKRDQKECKQGQDRFVR